MGYTPSLTSSLIKEMIYKEIIEYIKLHEGEEITPILMRETQEGIHSILSHHVGNTIKWKNNHKITVEETKKPIGFLHIKLPKWLEDWLESDDEEI